jgi:hypothetical protein
MLPKGMQSLLSKRGVPGWVISGLAVAWGLWDLANHLSTGSFVLSLASWINDPKNAPTVSRCVDLIAKWGPIPVFMIGFGLLFYVATHPKVKPPDTKLLPANAPEIEALRAGGVEPGQLSLANVPSHIVVLTAENGPGRALVRVENHGTCATFTASAKVKGIHETVPNRKFLETYALRWGSNGRDELTIGAGAAASLIVASTRPTGGKASSDGLFELLLEGYVEGQAAKTNFFRWHGSDPHGSVKVDLEITVSSTSVAATRQQFTVTTLRGGGIQITETAAEEDTATSPPLPVQVETPTHITLRCTKGTQNLTFPYCRYNSGDHCCPRSPAGLREKGLTGAFGRAEAPFCG